ncbi:FAD-dependent thymidylate synthase [Flavobacterium sp.]|uniref:FAD-dependent thymidylate synthase n=1 Tax=Flavobacterium sp. TaxID=239 RepID=UPI0038FCDFE8
MNKNSVTLIGFYGSDEIHACSAWTSTSREITNEKRERIPKLLKMLAEAGHHTPFEKSSLHFLVTSEIASHIQKLKHRIGVSINGESARYKELKEDKYYIPNDWPAGWQEELENYTKQGLVLYHKCLESLVNDYQFDKKRAKESARFFRGYNTQIDVDIMFNWRSFWHFLNLRNSPHSQKEIREIAAEMLDSVKNIEGNPFKYTLEAFNL